MTSAATAPAVSYHPQTWVKITWMVFWIIALFGPVFLMVFWPNVSVALAVVAIIVNIFLPYGIDWALEGFHLGMKKHELSMALHVHSTLTSASVMFLWGLMVLLAEPPSWARVISGLYLLVAVVAGGLVLRRPTFWMNVTAYEQEKSVSWIWPRTIDTPLTWLRTGLAAAMVVIAMFGYLFPDVF